MFHTIPVRDGLTLTEFRPGDQANLVRYLNDPELYRNTLSVPSPYTRQHADEWLEKQALREKEYGMPTDWALRHPTGGVIGGTGMFLKKGLDGHLDEVGYWLAEPFRGRGIMTAAVCAFVEWQFAQRPPLHRIEAIVYAHNPASARLLEKSGFGREGYLRDYVLKDGRFHDAILLAKIRS